MNIEQKLLQQVSENKNYNKCIFNIFKKYIGKNILEVGGGLGAMTKFLIAQGNVTFTDINQNYVELVKGRFRRNKGFKAVNNDISLNIDNLIKGGYDAVVCINVLHHIKDDNGALLNIFNLLKSGGKFILIEPAMKCLYGLLDKEENNYRRYSKKEVKEKLIKSGFKINKCFLINSLGAIGWFVNGRILKKKELPVFSFKLYDKLVPFFIKLDILFRFPFGLSVVCISEK